MQIDIRGWKQPELPEFDKTGSARGKRHQIAPQAVRIAVELLPEIVKKIQKEYLERDRVVIAFAGGSGAGKSDISALIAFDLNQLGIFAYRLAGDNYPRRVPPLNDEERIRIFRTEGVKALLESGNYSDEISAVLKDLWENDRDSDPHEISRHPWLAVYQKAGIMALRNYLGKPAEQDFDDINRVVRAFRNGDKSIWCKQMGRSESSMHYERAQFPDAAVMVLDWTHALSPDLAGIDIAVLLASTPEETKAIRVARARDSKPDSSFVTMVLGIEQNSINQRASAASIIVDRQGRFLSLEAFQERYCGR